jgi:hypothetical protein
MEVKKTLRIKLNEYRKELIGESSWKSLLLEAIKY